jgi:hypothetical protein
MHCLRSASRDPPEMLYNLVANGLDNALIGAKVVAKTKLKIWRN